jgi:hypothetical protein
MKKLFVSYSHKDKAFAGRLVADLRQSRFRVWWDDHELKIGESIVDRVSQGIRDADYLITILSPESVASRWSHEELRQAESLRLSGTSGLRVLPVLYRDCEVPTFLLGILYADFRDDAVYGESLARLLKSMTEDEAVSFYANEHNFIDALHLPRFYDGQFLTVLSLLRFQIAVNAIQGSLKLQTTPFKPFTQGQFLGPEDFNQLTPPVQAIRETLGLSTKFLHFPFYKGQSLKSEELNELVDIINEVIDRVRDRHTPRNG